MRTLHKVSQLYEGKPRISASKEERAHITQ